MDKLVGEFVGLAVEGMARTQTLLRLLSESFTFEDINKDLRDDITEVNDILHSVPAESITNANDSLRAYFQKLQERGAAHNHQQQRANNQVPTARRNEISNRPKRLRKRYHPKTSNLSESPSVRQRLSTQFQSNKSSSSDSDSQLKKSSQRRVQKRKAKKDELVSKPMKRNAHCDRANNEVPTAKRCAKLNQSKRLRKRSHPEISSLSESPSVRQRLYTQFQSNKSSSSVSEDSQLKKLSQRRAQKRKTKKDELVSKPKFGEKSAKRNAHCDSEGSIMSPVSSNELSLSNDELNRMKCAVVKLVDVLNDPSLENNVHVAQFKQSIYSKDSDENEYEIEDNVDILDEDEEKQSDNCDDSMSDYDDDDNGEKDFSKASSSQPNEQLNDADDEAASGVSSAEKEDKDDDGEEEADDEEEVDNNEARISNEKENSSPNGPKSHEQSDESAEYQEGPKSHEQSDESAEYQEGPKSHDDLSDGSAEYQEENLKEKPEEVTPFTKTCKKKESYSIYFSEEELDYEP